MAYYNVCPECGSNLDPGERCDCIREKERLRDDVRKILSVGKGGQYEFGFTEEYKYESA